MEGMGVNWKDSYLHETQNNTRAHNDAATIRRQRQKKGDEKTVVIPPPTVNDVSLDFVLTTVNLVPTTVNLVPTTVNEGLAIVLTKVVHALVPLDVI
jgi:hypothetical protein